MFSKMKYLILIAIFTILQISIANGLPKIKPRIFGGHEIKLNERSFYKHQVLVYADGSYLCSGSIISPNCIITAAHCLLNMSRATIAAGLYDLSDVTKAEQIILIKKDNWKIHKDYDYNDTAANDIAIINLPTTIKYTDFVGPIKIECDNNERHENEMVRISGWGKHTDEDFEDTTILRSVEVKTIPFLSCEKTYGFKKNFPTMICIDGKLSHGSCEGDSGGPIVSIKNGKLIGVVSFGAEKCETEYPRVSTRLSEYSQWIQENTIDKTAGC